MMRTRGTRLTPAVISITMAAQLVGCGGGGAKSADPPAVVMADREAHTDARIKAIRASWDAVERGEADRAATREQLKKIVWSRSTYGNVRLAAYETLLLDQQSLDDTRTMSGLLLPTETSWPFIDRIGNEAVNRGWTQLAPALVRSWSRPVPEPTDAERPERRALAALFPDRPVEDTVYAVFAGELTDGKAMRERDRMDAWALLRRIDPDNERTLALLSSGTPDSADELLAALRAGARDLRAIPDSSEQLAWLRRLREPANQPAWSRASAAIATLTPEQTRGLQLRHAAVIAWAADHQPQWLTRSRDELLSDFERSMDGRKTTFRVADNIGGFPQESLRLHRDKVTWGDALSLLVALDAVDQPQVIAALFDQADRDLIDRSTEHGGVLAANPTSPGMFNAVHYPPRPAQRRGDTTFTPSQDMINAGDTAPFHYHFHCTSHTNAEYAGPSSGDIDTARILGRNSLVFTFTSRDALNADYYDGNGVRIDLGTLSRPTGNPRGARGTR